MRGERVKEKEGEVGVWGYEYAAVVVVKLKCTYRSENLTKRRCRQKLICDRNGLYVVKAETDMFNVHRYMYIFQAD